MSEAKKRKKAYYAKSSKRNKSNGCQLDAGMRGFLITCNNNEKRAVQEAYNLLNEYADAMYGPEEGVNESASSSDEDMEKAVNKEVEAMSKTNKSVRRFQAATTKTTNCIFIGTNLERPDELAAKIFLDVADTHESKSRFILKFFPVMGTCKASTDKIEKLAEEIMRNFVNGADENVTYATIYKVRCNNLGREAILPLIGTVMIRLNPKIRVNFNEPDFVISVDVLQKICCISVLRNFYKYRKYNIQELASLHVKPTIGKPDQAVEKLETAVSEKLEPLSGGDLVEKVEKSTVFLEAEEKDTENGNLETDFGTDETGVVENLVEPVVVNNELRIDEENTQSEISEINLEAVTEIKSLAE